LSGLHALFGLCCVGACSVAGALAQGTPTPAPVAGVERWPLARFEAEAQKRNLAIDVAREEVRLNAARRMEAAWARFPRFEWTSTASPMGAMKGDVVNTTTPTNQYFGFDGILQQHKLEVVWPLFTFGKLRNAKRAAEAGVRAATHDVDRARAEVLRDVRRAYWAVKVSSEVLKVVDEGFDRIRAAENKLDELIAKKAKDVTPLDKNRLATFGAEVSSRREEAIAFEALSKSALRVVSGLPEAANIDADTAPLALAKTVVPPVDELIRIALAERPELKALGAVVDVRRSLAALSRSFYYPDFFLAGQVGVARCNVCADQTNPFAFDPFNMDLYGAALGVRLTLDIPQKIARARQADAELRKIEAQRRRATDGITLEVRKAWLEWRQAKEQAALITKGRKSAQGWLFQATINFSTGLMKLRDLTDALAAWFKFRLEELRSVFNYNVAVAVLEQVTGRELPTVR
jgi:outer membrane protein TolC